MLQLFFFLTEYYPLSLPIFLTHILDWSLADVNDKGKLNLSIMPSLGARREEFLETEMPDAHDTQSRENREPA